MLRLFAQRASAAVILSCVTRARSSLGSSTTMSKQVSSPISEARSPRQLWRRDQTTDAASNLSLSLDCITQQRSNEEERRRVHL